jgi:hypothetical protein
MTTARSAVIVLVLVSVIVVSGCAAGSGAGSGADDAAMSEGSSGRSSLSLDEQAALIDQVARGKFPDVYAGLDVNHGGVTVYRTMGDGWRAFDEAVRGLGLADPVAMREAPYSAVELDRLVQQIVGDREYWAGKGVVISSVNARQDGTTVEVGIADSARAGQLLTDRYGTVPPITVIQMGPIAPVPG